MKRPTVAVLTLLALLAGAPSLFAQAEVSPPSLGPEEKSATETGDATAEQPGAAVTLFRSSMQQIIVKPTPNTQVDGGIAAMVQIVSGEGRTYSYVIQGKDDATNLRAALAMAEQLRGCKKIVINKLTRDKQLGALVEDFSLYVFSDR